MGGTTPFKRMYTEIYPYISVLCVVFPISAVILVRCVPPRPATISIALVSFILSHAASHASKLAFKPATISAFAVFPVAGFGLRSPVKPLHVPI